MNRNHEDQGHPIRPLVRAAVILLLLLLVTAGVQSWRDLADTRDLKTSLESEIATTEESIHLLRDRLRRIEGDPATLEQLAREELGWVSEEDIVVVLPLRAEEDSDSEVSAGSDGPSSDPIPLP
ncbi:MAG: septum formation initiator family protein [Thermoanaerobaculia bacterium]|nr:septum formation initiator family protein [Thermoanaerobaculia bacterium]